MGDVRSKSIKKWVFLLVFGHFFKSGRENKELNVGVCVGKQLANLKRQKK